MEVKIIQFPLHNENYYKNNVWDLTKHPNNEIATFYSKRPLKYRTLNFSIIKYKRKRREAKRFFAAVFEGILDIKYTNKTFYSYWGIPVLANKIKEKSFLYVDVAKLKEIYLDIIKEQKLNARAFQCIQTFYDCLYDLNDIRIGFERDIWHLDTLNISEERINKTSNIKTFDFRGIINHYSREYAKAWIKYLLGNTEYTISVISNYLLKFKLFVNNFPDKDPFKITTSDVDDLVTKWHKENKTSEYIYRALFNSNGFYKYFSAHNMKDCISPIEDKHFGDIDYNTDTSVVSDFIIIQLFKNLDILNLPDRIMFLINYCTGMRASDVCQIRSSNCLYYDGTDDGYFINYHCQKMNKPQMNLIPKSLYMMIDDYKKTIINYSQYLFPSPTNKNNPMPTDTYSARINKWVKTCNICNEDGTPYVFQSHSFRRTLATDLYQNYNVDLHIIQLSVLHHQQIEMSLVYIKRSNDYKKELHDKYINNCGITSTLNGINDTETLKKKALGNGYCCYPTKVGCCPYSDICLKCEYFRTSKAFLDIHKKHLENINKEIEIFQKQNLIQNLATSLETKQILEKIIDSLETLE